MSHAIGVDVGGTFTDVVVIAADGGVVTAKAPTTPDDQSRGVMAGLALAAAGCGLSPAALLADTSRLVHGTTVATNALLEGKGARVGLLTTAGHRDVVEMREGLKPDRYNLRLPPPAPLVPRALRLPVTERMRADGSVAVPLDPASLDAALDRLVQAGVQSVAVCFLHAWANPAHEQAAAQAARARLPGAYVTASAEVLPEIKEFERFSTTVANALVGRLVRDYLARLEGRLRAAGLAVPPLIMQSHGGVATVAETVRLAAATALSGPAGGVAGATALARRGAGAELIAFDMGGTSTDIALIRGGAATLAEGRVIGAVRIALPSLDIVTLGAGGGSIAAVGADGLLRVGPESAGAVPGPACYGTGGTAATVTDADLVLGLLDPARFLGGAQRLDPAAAMRALAALGARFGLDAVAAAAGVQRVVDARMADGVRVATVRRGVDPRRSALLAFGGAAGLHAGAVAAALGMAHVVVPVQAAVLSAWGMLHADPTVQLVRSLRQGAGGIDPGALAAAFAAMAAEGRARLGAFGLDLHEIRSASMRYGEQVFEIAVGLDGIDLAAPDAAAAVAGRFHRRHAALFTYALPDEEVVAVSARLAMVARLPQAAAAPASPAAPRAPGARRAFLDGAWREVPVFAFEAPDGAAAIAGPALVEAATTTVLLRQGDRARFDPRLGLLIDVAPTP